MGSTDQLFSIAVKSALWSNMSSGSVDIYVVKRFQRHLLTTYGNNWSGVSIEIVFLEIESKVIHIMIGQLFHFDL